MRKRLRTLTFLYTLIALLAISPSVHPGGIHPSRSVSPPERTKWSIKKKLFVAGLCASCVAIVTIVAYRLTKNRKSTTEPTPMNLTAIGNENGQPVLYSHGLGGYFGQAYYYLNNKGYTRGTKYYCPHYIFDLSMHQIGTFSYPDSNVDRKRGAASRKRNNRIKNDHVSLGQENDMRQLNEAANEFNRENTIAFGVSRGASTVINLMGCRPNEHIKAMILEAPFSSIKDALTHIYAPKNFLKSLPLLNKTIGTAAHTITSALFPQYNMSGVQPIDVIDKIDPNIPILLIHSQKDDTCPYTGSCKLYIKRKKYLESLEAFTSEKEKNPNNLYFLRLKESDHGKGLTQTEGELFQNVVHAFYKKHGYPYNEEFAKKVVLEEYQPSIEEIEVEL